MKLCPYTQYTRFFFSPTGTTRSIVQAVSRGIAIPESRHTDITASADRSAPLHLDEGELLVIGVPVYAGRVPALLVDWLDELHAKNTPTVCLVVYGNREYEDALIELRDILQRRGCRPTAFGAFIGEHSFSSDETPIAVHRPDAEDIRQAEMFGKKVRQKLLAPKEIERDISIPGNVPYKEGMPRRNIECIEINEKCTQCGICATVCPVDAIDPDQDYRVDAGVCILCCACIKYCPEQARSMRSGPIKDIAVRLASTCRTRKEPEVFL